MTPRQLCNKLLHDLLVGKCLRKGTHVFEVSRRKARHLGKIATEISSEPIDHAGPPSLGGPAGQDLAADAPIEQDKFSVDSDSHLQAASFVRRQLQSDPEVV